MIKLKNLGTFNALKVYKNDTFIGYIKRDHKLATKYSSYNANGMRIDSKSHSKEKAINLVESKFQNF